MKDWTQWKTWTNRQLRTALLLFGVTSVCIMFTLYQKQERIMDMGVFVRGQLWRLAKHKNLETCGEVPKDLVGAVKMDLKPKPMSEIERHLPWIQRGGHYRPNRCIARQKLAVIIPCRNRYEHLKVLLLHLHPILRSQEIDYTIYVVEQAQQGTFNKGMLMNIGFIEAARKEKYDCFVFHDVDLIPENGHTMYRCSKKPLQLSYISKFNYTVNAAGVGFERIPAKNGRYTMIKHGPNAGNRKGETGYVQQLLGNAKSRYKKDGLSTIVYQLLDIEQYPLYTKIYANIARRDIEKRCKDLINHPRGKREKQKVRNKKTNN